MRFFGKIHDLARWRHVITQLTLKEGSAIITFDQMNFFDVDLSQEEKMIVIDAWQKNWFRVTTFSLLPS